MNGLGQAVGGLEEFCPLRPDKGTLANVMEKDLNVKAQFLKLRIITFL